MVKSKSRDSREFLEDADTEMLDGSPGWAARYPQSSTDEGASWAAAVHRGVTPGVQAQLRSQLLFAWPPAAVTPSVLCGNHNT